MNRLQLIHKHLAESEVAKDTVSITDNRTGKTFEFNVKDGAINANDFLKLKDPKGNVTRIYDPAYMNTVNCVSKISFIDGDKGILEYRGYPIEQLAEKASFLEVAFLLIFGELPTADQLKKFEKKVMTHTFYHNELNNMMKSFRYDAHPMGMFISTMSAFSTFHPEANPALAGSDVYKNKELRNK